MLQFLVFLHHGAVGVSEGGFIAIYNQIYNNNVNGAMLLNRGVNFYLFVIMSNYVQHSLCI